MGNPTWILATSKGTDGAKPCSVLSCYPQKAFAQGREQSPPNAGLLLWVFLSSVKPCFVQADSETLLAA